MGEVNYMVRSEATMQGGTATREAGRGRSAIPMARSIHFPRCHPPLPWRGDGVWRPPSAAEAATGEVGRRAAAVFASSVVERATSARGSSGRKGRGHGGGGGTGRGSDGDARALGEGATVAHGNKAMVAAADP